MKRPIALLPAFLLLCASFASVQATPLTTLFSGGTLTAGDKLFDQWGLVSATTSSGRVVNVGNIDVITLGPSGLNPLDPGPGLRFNVLNSELNVIGDGTYAFIDLQFRFHVSALDPGLLIKDISLASQSSQIHTPDGANDLGTYILESVGSAAGLNDLAIVAAEFSVLDDVLTNSSTASTTFAPQRGVWVTKNILVWSRDVTDSAALDAFEQRFSHLINVAAYGFCRSTIISRKKIIH